jgi:hypothetical protein
MPKAQTARLLAISERPFWYKLKKYALVNLDVAKNSGCESLFDKFKALAHHRVVPDVERRSPIGLDE